MEDYITYWEKLNRRSIRLIEKIADPAFTFRDPFHEVAGLDAFEAMLEASFRRVKTMRFKATDHAFGRDGHTAYIRWTSVIVPNRGKKTFTIVGMSEVAFNNDGKVVSHVDHWDSAGQFWEHMPVIGAILRWARKRLR